MSLIYKEHYAMRDLYCREYEVDSIKNRTQMIHWAALIAEIPELNISALGFEGLEGYDGPYVPVNNNINELTFIQIVVARIRLKIFIISMRLQITQK